MSVQGAMLEALRALKMDLEDAGIEPTQFAGALDRLSEAIEDDRVDTQKLLAELKSEREEADRRWDASWAERARRWRTGP